MNELELGRMSMSTMKGNDVSVCIKGNGMAIIDWGRSSCKVELKKDVIFSFKNTYDYCGTPAHVITITGENITYLYCRENKLIELDVRGNSKLKELDLRYNDIEELDVSNNSDLEYLNIRYNKLKKLDLRKNSKLKSLYYGNNQLSLSDIIGYESINFLKE